MHLKIISVRPLSGCDRSYRKILKEGIEYKIYDETKTKAKVPNDFFKVGKINVNISAIVGKNGSGKSSLIELMLRIINNFYFHYGNQEQQDVSFVEGLHAELIFETTHQYKIITTSVGTEVYQSVKGNWKKLSRKTIQSLDFFYTVVVNYSHYAYNQKDFAPEGDWIEKLFHKNDGYQMPIVLNPYREDGVIDINNESDLMRARLLSNLAQPAYKRDERNFRSIRKGLEVKRLVLTFNRRILNKKIFDEIDIAASTRDNVAYREVRFSDLKVNREKLFKELKTQTSIDFTKLDSNYAPVLDYIIYKLVSISVKYRDFEIYFNKETKDFRHEDLKVYLTQLLKQDKSHIGFKVKQALNLLKYKHFELKNQPLDLERFSQIVSRTARKSTKRETTGSVRLIEFLPPPVFKVEILLSASDRNLTIVLPDGSVKRNLTKKETVYFSQLSSGEKQRIFSISSITYHLLNLDSISKTANRRPYHHVNIILEEIELYFHPEMQRLFVDDVLWAIANIQLHKIESINFCFVTHSPFTLSDIPSSNVLFLDDTGVPSTAPVENTFGGNIHDLLAESFFLDKGLIGEFARKKIENVIELLQPERKGRKRGAVGIKKIQDVINLIGEPFLKDKLQQMMADKFTNERRRRIAELKRELNRLESADL